MKMIFYAKFIASIFLDASHVIRYPRMKLNLKAISLVNISTPLCKTTGIFCCLLSYKISIVETYIIVKFIPGMLVIGQDMSI